MWLEIIEDPGSIGVSMVLRKKNVPEYNNIKVIFIYLFSPSYFGDYLDIYDGSSNASPMIARYCGDLLPPSQRSSTNEVLILLTTDDYKTKKGFKLAYHPWSKYFHT